MLLLGLRRPLPGAIGGKGVDSGTGTTGHGGDPSALPSTAMVEPVPIDDLAAALGLGAHELVSLVGGGGKTTALFALGRQLRGTRILTTTTKMGRNRTGGRPLLLSPTDDEVEAAAAAHGSVLVWRAEDGHKALGVAGETCERWFTRADHVIVEADGSRQRPFKAPADHEPVVPAGSTFVVACVGAAALGRPITAGCHRPELVAALAGCEPHDPLTPGRLAAVLTHPDGSRKNCPPGAAYAVLVNRVDDDRRDDVAAIAVAVAPTPVIAVAPFEPGNSPELP